MSGLAPAPHRLVLVTRPAADAERTAQALRGRGIDALIDPLTRPVDLAPPAALPRPQAWAATSANGVAALARALTAQGRGLSGTPLLAVGGRTALAARAAGFDRVLDADGDGAALAALAARVLLPGAGPLAHAAGAEVAVDLAASLAPLGHEVVVLALYRMEDAPALAPATLAALGDGRLDAVLLFSPRSARTFVSLAARAGAAPDLRRVDAVCLSPAVATAAGEAAALAGARFAHILAAAKPTAQALIDLLGCDSAP